MDNSKLETKLVEFYTHYKAITNLINLLTETLLNDDTNQVPRSQIDTMVETIAQKNEGKLEMLDEILNEVQES